MSPVHEDDKPFFSREKIKEFITDAASSRRLIIYAGAGVTIDRSGLSWGKLVDGLLENYITSEDQRRRILNEMPPQEAASVASQLYFDDHSVDFRDRLTDQLRVLLYNTGQWQKGELARNIARLSLSMNRRELQRSASKSASKDDQGNGVVIVTPNYDSYIIEELREEAQARVRQRKLTPRLLFPTLTDPLRTRVFHDQHSESEPPDLERWLQQGAFDPKAPACVHLHGFVPRATSPAGKTALELYRHPVVSEQDYFITARSSYEALRALFEKSAVLMVGSSLTDPPLLRALAATRASSEMYPRWAIVPEGIGEPSGERRHMRRHLARRFDHFGVTPVFVDLYSQVQQVFDEINFVSHLANPYDYLVGSSRSAVSYGSRLIDWSKLWKAATDADPDGGAQGTQIDFSNILSALREDIITELDAPPGEGFKVELWLRRDPHQRSMHLWASSTGVHLDDASMREALISAKSDFAAIRAFTAGRPVFVQLKANELPNQRWRTYLSCPIFFEGTGGDRIPVGSIVLGSRYAVGDSALSPESDKVAMIAVIELMRAVGELLVMPDRDEWKSLFDQYL